MRDKAMSDTVRDFVIRGVYTMPVFLSSHFCRQTMCGASSPGAGAVKTGARGCSVADGPLIVTDRQALVALPTEHHVRHQPLLVTRAFHHGSSQG
jgi:hypothetical protein